MAIQRRELAFWAGLLVILAVLLATFREILLPFVSGLVLAYFLNPLADALEKRGCPRGLAAGLVVGLLVVAIVLAAIFLVPLLAVQAKSFAVSLPDQLTRLRDMAEELARERLGSHFPAFQAALANAIGDIKGGISGVATAVATGIWGQGRSIMTLLSVLFVTPLVVFYLLVDWHGILDRICSWLPRDHEATVCRLAGEIDEAVSAFIRGQGIICLLLGAFYAVGLTLVGLNYGAAIGIATGLMGFVPVVGWLVGTLVALTVALSQFGLVPLALAKVLAVMVAGTAIETAVLSPKLVGARIGLHPVWLIFALFAFSYLLGLLGALIAVPLAAATGVLVRHALSVYLKSEVYRGTAPAEPGGPR